MTNLSKISCVKILIKSILHNHKKVSLEKKTVAGHWTRLLFIEGVHIGVLGHCATQPNVLQLCGISRRIHSHRVFCFRAWHITYFLGICYRAFLLLVLRKSTESKTFCQRSFFTQKILNIIANLFCNSSTWYEIMLHGFQIYFSSNPKLKGRT